MDKVKQQILMDLLEYGKIVPNDIYPNVAIMYQLVQQLIREGFIEQRGNFITPYRWVVVKEVVEALFYGNHSNT